MNRLMRIAVALCGLFLIPLSSASAQDSAAKTSGEIVHLLDFVHVSKCTFIRNGSEYDGAKAADHLKTKYDYFKSDIHSTEDFIDLAATKSAFSGKPYLVHCPGMQTIAASDWLKIELQTYRSKQTSN
jgi:hypothetical protein